MSPDGEVISVTVTEPRFTPRERMLLLASRAQDRVGPHGRPMSEALDPANEHAYSVGLPLKDHAANAIKRAQDGYEKEWPEADMSVLVWPIEFHPPEDA